MEEPSFVVHDDVRQSQQGQTKHTPTTFTLSKPVKSDNTPTKMGSNNALNAKGPNKSIGSLDNNVNNNNINNNINDNDSFLETLHLTPFNATEEAQRSFENISSSHISPSKSSYKSNQPMDAPSLVLQLSLRF